MSVSNMRFLMDERAERAVVSPAAATRSALRGFEAAPARERRATAPFWMVVRGTCVGYFCSGLCYMKGCGFVVGCCGGV